MNESIYFDAKSNCNRAKNSDGGSYSNGLKGMHSKRKFEMNELRNIYSAEVLMGEFLIPLEISAY
jgi:hypothetical protein